MKPEYKVGDNVIYDIYSKNLFEFSGDELDLFVVKFDFGEVINVKEKNKNIIYTIRYMCYTLREREFQEQYVLCSEKEYNKNIEAIKEKERKFQLMFAKTYKEIGYKFYHSKPACSAKIGFRSFIHYYRRGLTRFLWYEIFEEIINKKNEKTEIEILRLMELVIDSKFECLDCFCKLAIYQLSKIKKLVQESNFSTPSLLKLVEKDDEWNPLLFIKAHGELIKIIDKNNNINNNQEKQ